MITRSLSRALMVTLVVASLVGCGLQKAASPGMPSKTSAEKPGPLPVPVSNVKVQKLADSTQRIGRLEAQSVVEIRPRVAGSISAILVEDGAQVIPGQALLKIDARPYLAQRDRAAAQLAQAEAALAQAIADLERGERIAAADKEAIGAEELERRTLTKASAMAAKAAAAAMLVASELDVEWTTVTAPIAGRLGKIMVELGGLVDRGMPVLVTIVAAETLEVVVPLDDQEADKLARLPNKNPTIIVNGPGATRAGKVTFIDPQSQTGATVMVRGVVDNKDLSWRAGSTVTVELPQSVDRDVFSIPETAISVDGSYRFVLVPNAEGRVGFRPVQIGRRLSGDHREILAGLGPQDLVITHPVLMRVHPGAVISPVLSTTTAAIAP